MYNPNKMSNELKNIVNEMFKSDMNLNQVFFDTLFRSTQQLHAILSVINSLDEFIHYLTELIYINDVYSQLLRSIKMTKM